MRRRGTTLLEAMLTCAMLGALFVLLMSIYLVCLRAWHKSNTQSNLVQDARLALSRLTREAARSSGAGLSSQDHSFTLLCPAQKDGKLDLDGELGVVWDHYLTCSLQGDNLQVQMASLKPNDEGRLAPLPISQLDPQPRPNPPEIWLREVDKFEVTKVGVRCLQLDLTLRRHHYGQRTPEIVRRVVSLRILN
ncbi:MAG: hypothetical protein U0931_13275 [Vulcanimicrobiota bacterium]